MNKYKILAPMSLLLVFSITISTTSLLPSELYKYAEYFFIINLVLILLFFYKWFKIYKS